MTYLLIGLGGFLGSISRYILSIKLPFLSEWNIALINVCGCFLIAWISKDLHSHTHALLVIGFLGSFTTFSTFITHLDSALSAQLILKFFLLLFFQVIGGFLMYKIALKL